jgi:hypothetical protein
MMTTSAAIRRLLPLPAIYVPRGSLSPCFPLPLTLFLFIFCFGRANNQALEKIWIKAAFDLGVYISAARYMKKINVDRFKLRISERFADIGFDFLDCLAPITVSNGFRSRY